MASVPKPRSDEWRASGGESCDPPEHLRVGPQDSGAHRRDAKGAESIRLGFAFAKIYPPPYCLLEWFAGECFQSFASISNRGFVIRISAGGRSGAKPPSPEASARRGVRGGTGLRSVEYGPLCRSFPKPLAAGYHIVTTFARPSTVKYQISGVNSNGNQQLRGWRRSARYRGEYNVLGLAVRAGRLSSFFGVEIAEK